MWGSLLGGACLALLVTSSMGAALGAAANAAARVKRQITVNTDCEKGDIVLVLDSSGSVGANNWEFIKQFGKDFTEEFVIGPENVQVDTMNFP